jgi:carbon monoxide dehydrogenase subunit G
MKVTGSATLSAPREKVWAALNDPAVLVRTIPGCLQLEEVGPDAYRMTITAGVASIKGTYQGDVQLTDHDHPSAFTLKASGAGAPGTVTADVRVTLADDGEGGQAATRLDYHADAVVGGMIGGVGQRVLTGVAKKTAGEFFAAVDDVLTGRAPSVPAPREEPTGLAVAPGAEAAGVYLAPGKPAPAALTGDQFLRGAVFGAVVALAGVLVGGLVSRRRTG